LIIDKLRYFKLDELEFFIYIPNLAVIKTKTVREKVVGFEVDFLPVGENEYCGDAIAIRFWEPTNFKSQRVWIIDGGTKESGEALVDHIRKYYQTNLVNVVVSTHPDLDHVSGLSVVLEKMEVKYLLIHQPWNYAQEVHQLFKDKRVTPPGIEKRVLQTLQSAYDLETIAEKKNIKIIEPFSSNNSYKLGSNAKVYILSPSETFYQNQLANFRCMPNVEKKKSLSEILVKEQTTTISATREKWTLETLIDPEDNDTSAENNSSVILLFEIDNHRLLFTGDAGVPALNEAVKLAKNLNIDLTTVKFIQVPHHGSKRNVGPTILNQIIGPNVYSIYKIMGPINDSRPYEKTAFISAPKNGQPKHPYKKVVNAFRRRRAKVFATSGKGLWYHSQDAPPRDHYYSAKPLPFYDKVDD